MSKKYNIQFLEDKLGPFDTEFKYPRISLIEGPLFYIEKQTKNQLEEEIKTIKTNESMNPTYIWGFVIESNAIYVTRTFGENKVFIYNPTSMNKTEYVKGKLKVLNELQEDTIDKLFDQKAVFDYFYKKLWDLRLELGREIRDKNDIPDNIALMEAQHIIDRIIFTYFICEKGLVSVKDYGPITGKELFSDIIGQLPDTWDYLKKLFFEQFAKSGVKDLDCGGDVYLKTPYLNGGLFRPKIISKISENDLKIEYEWNEIFDPLNKYSWIIEDKITDLEGEYEGNLTPEIIGHIYEKFVISIAELDEIAIDDLNVSKAGDLKKGNKKIGAYYTPENITDYFARHTIIPYLFPNEEINYYHNFDKYLHNLDSNKLHELLDNLNKVKVCDPACGSGAFLLKVGEVLLEYKTNILHKLNVKFDYYILKKDIIVNNLYGTDIQEGAVEICKLRLWLWLISTKTDKIETLPNIEYNFISGNSIIGWVNEKLGQNVLVKIDEKVFWTLDALKTGYESEQQQIIIQAIDLLKKTDMNSYANAFSLLKSLYSYSAGEKAEILKITLERIKSIIYQKIDGIYYDYINSNICKIKEDSYNELNALHWKVDFKDVFEKGGFDIIIGNPPWAAKFSTEENRLLAKKLGWASKNINICSLFISESLKKLNNGGIFGFLLPKVVVKNTAYFPVRTEILEAYDINELIDFGQFPGVASDAIGLIIRINKSESNTQISFYEDDNLVRTSEIDQNIFLKNSSHVFSLSITPEIQDILDKIQVGTKELRKIFNVKRGIELGQKSMVVECPHCGNINEAGSKYYGSIKKVCKKCKNVLDLEKSFSISSEKRSDFYVKKCLSGTYVGRYTINNNYYIPEDLKGINYKKEIFEGNKIFIRRISDKIQGMFSDEDLLAFNTVYSIYNENMPEECFKFVLGILNSTLMHFYYEFSYNVGMNLTTQVTIDFLSKVPIKLASDSHYKQIIENVNIIIENDSLNKDYQSTSDRIDSIVYDLYGLNSNEIKIIEENMR